MARIRHSRDPAEEVGEPSPDAIDPVIQAYMKNVDRTLLRENLKLTPEQRAEQLVRFLANLAALREAELLSRKPPA